MRFASTAETKTAAETPRPTSPTDPEQRFNIKGAPYATGDELAEEAHPEEFASTELTGPFGTRENPVQVTSFLGYRVVGCQGGAGHDHEILWHMVKAGKPTICLECGQFFDLKLLKKPADHGHGHH